MTIEASTTAETETRSFTASVYRDGEWFAAQALEVDVASHGRSAGEALDSLREALTLYFAPPDRARCPASTALRSRSPQPPPRPTPERVRWRA